MFVQKNKIWINGYLGKQSKSQMTPTNFRTTLFRQITLVQWTERKFSKYITSNFPWYWEGIFKDGIQYHLSFRSNTLITTVSVVIHLTTLEQAHIFAGLDYTGPYTRIYIRFQCFIHTDTNTRRTYCYMFHIMHE